MTVEIIDCTNPAELFRHYDRQNQAQDAHIELDLRDGKMCADYNAEIGNAVPFDVHHGFIRRWSIPVLTADAANRVMRELAPLAARMLADWEQVWDGNNRVAQLGSDAADAEDEITAQLGSEGEHPFAEEDLVGQWDIEGATNGAEATEYHITASTTDERLEEIEQQILHDLAECTDSRVVVCPELSDYLKDLRRQAADEEDDEDSTTVDAPDEQVAVWSVVRGESPTARAVDPGSAGVSIPDAIVNWATRHGLSQQDPDVYLLVTTREQAGIIDREIAWREHPCAPEDMTALHNALTHHTH